MKVRVMVVDDEPIAAQATSMMIRRADPGLEVVGVCHSGRAAVNQAAALHPDVVVIDIQMPGINGLEAMKRILESSPSTSFVVLSAYSEFAYAVEALSMGASDYLLKPVKQVNFTASMRKVMMDVLARKESMDQELKQQEQLQIAEPMIQKDFLLALVPGAGADERLVACADFLGFADRTAVAFALARRGEGQLHADHIAPHGPRLPKGSICELVRPNLIVGIAPAAPGGGAALAGELLRQLDQLTGETQPVSDLLAGVGEPAVGPIRMKTSLLQAMSALRYLQQEETGPRAAAFDAGRMGLSPERSGAPEEDGALSNSGQIIKWATLYIDTNFHREVSLDEAALSVNLSPYYFSRLFKEHTGMNYTEYLQQVRIERAKELLAETSASIKEVAGQVGYHDPNYFSKVFRKVTGYKASDYRALRQSGDAGRGA